MQEKQIKTWRASGSRSDRAGTGGRLGGFAITLGLASIGGLDSRVRGNDDERLMPACATVQLSREMDKRLRPGFMNFIHDISHK